MDTSPFEVPVKNISVGDASAKVSTLISQLYYGNQENRYEEDTDKIVKEYDKKNRKAENFTKENHNDKHAIINTINITSLSVQYLPQGQPNATKIKIHSDRLREYNITNVMTELNPDVDIVHIPSDIIVSEATTLPSLWAGTTASAVAHFEGKGAPNDLETVTVNKTSISSPKMNGFGSNVFVGRTPGPILPNTEEPGYSRLGIITWATIHDERPTTPLSLQYQGATRTTLRPTHSKYPQLLGADLTVFDNLLKVADSSSSTPVGDVMVNSRTERPITTTTTKSSTHANHSSLNNDMAIVNSLLSFMLHKPSTAEPAISASGLVSSTARPQVDHALSHSTLQDFLSHYYSADQLLNLMSTFSPFLPIKSSSTGAVMDTKTEDTLPTAPSVVHQTTTRHYATSFPLEQYTSSDGNFTTVPAFSSDIPIIFPYEGLNVITKNRQPFTTLVATTTVKPITKDRLSDENAPWFVANDALIITSTKQPFTRPASRLTTATQLTEQPNTIKSFTLSERAPPDTQHRETFSRQPVPSPASTITATTHELLGVSHFVDASSSVINFHSIRPTTTTSSLSTVSSTSVLMTTTIPHWEDPSQALYIRTTTRRPLPIPSLTPPIINSLLNHKPPSSVNDNSRNVTHASRPLYSLSIAITDKPSLSNWYTPWEVPKSTVYGNSTSSFMGSSISTPQSKEEKGKQDPTTSSYPWMIINNNIHVISTTRRSYFQPSLTTSSSTSNSIATRLDPDPYIRKTPITTEPLVTSDMAMTTFNPLYFETTTRRPFVRSPSTPRNKRRPPHQPYNAKNDLTTLISLLDSNQLKGTTAVPAVDWTSVTRSQPDISSSVVKTSDAEATINNFMPLPAKNNETELFLPYETSSSSHSSIILSPMQNKVSESHNITSFLPSSNNTSEDPAIKTTTLQEEALYDPSKYWFSAMSRRPSTTPETPQTIKGSLTNSWSPDTWYDSLLKTPASPTVSTHDATASIISSETWWDLHRASESKSRMTSPSPVLKSTSFKLKEPDQVHDVISSDPITNEIANASASFLNHSTSNRSPQTHSSSTQPYAVLHSEFFKHSFITSATSFTTDGALSSSSNYQAPLVTLPQIKLTKTNYLPNTSVLNTDFVQNVPSWRPGPQFSMQNITALTTADTWDESYVNYAVTNSSHVSLAGGGPLNVTSPSTTSGFLVTTLSNGSWEPPGAKINDTILRIPLDYTSGVAATTDNVYANAYMNSTSAVFKPHVQKLQLLMNAAKNILPQNISDTEILNHIINIIKHKQTPVLNINQLEIPETTQTTIRPQQVTTQPRMTLRDSSKITVTTVTHTVTWLPGDHVSLPREPQYAQITVTQSTLATSVPKVQFLTPSTTVFTSSEPAWSATLVSIHPQQTYLVAPSSVTYFHGDLVSLQAVTVLETGNSHDPFSDPSNVVTTIPTASVEHLALIPSAIYSSLTESMQSFLPDANSDISAVHGALTIRPSASSLSLNTYRQHLSKEAATEMIVFHSSFGEVMVPSSAWIYFSDPLAMSATATTIPSTPPQDAHASLPSSTTVYQPTHNNSDFVAPPGTAGVWPGFPQRGSYPIQAVHYLGGGQGAQADTGINSNNLTNGVQETYSGTTLAFNPKLSIANSEITQTFSNIPQPHIPTTHLPSDFSNQRPSVTESAEIPHQFQNSVNTRLQRITETNLPGNTSENSSQGVINGEVTLGVRNMSSGHVVNNKPIQTSDSSSLFPDTINSGIPNHLSVEWVKKQIQEYLATTTTTTPPPTTPLYNNIHEWVMGLLKHSTTTPRPTTTTITGIDIKIPLTFVNNLLSQLKVLDTFSSSRPTMNKFLLSPINPLHTVIKNLMKATQGNLSEAMVLVSSLSTTLSPSTASIPTEAGVISPPTLSTEILLQETSMPYSPDFHTNFPELGTTLHANSSSLTTTSTTQRDSVYALRDSTGVTPLPTSFPYVTTWAPSDILQTFQSVSDWEENIPGELSFTESSNSENEADFWQSSVVPQLHQHSDATQDTNSKIQSQNETTLRSEMKEDQLSRVSNEILTTYLTDKETSVNAHEHVFYDKHMHQTEKRTQNNITEAYLADSQVKTPHSKYMEEWMDILASVLNTSNPNASIAALGHMTSEDLLAVVMLNAVLESNRTYEEVYPDLAILRQVLFQLRGNSKFFYPQSSTVDVTDQSYADLLATLLKSKYEDRYPAAPSDVQENYVDSESYEQGDEIHNSVTYPSLFYSYLSTPTPDSFPAKPSVPLSIHKPSQPSQRPIQGLNFRPEQSSQRPIQKSTQKPIKEPDRRPLQQPSQSYTQRPTLFPNKSLDETGGAILHFPKPVFLPLNTDDLIATAQFQADPFHTEGYVQEILPLSPTPTYVVTPTTVIVTEAAPAVLDLSSVRPTSVFSQLQAESPPNSNGNMQQIKAAQTLRFQYSLSADSGGTQWPLASNTPMREPSQASWGPSITPGDPVTSIITEESLIFPSLWYTHSPTPVLTHSSATPQVEQAMFSSSSFNREKMSSSSVSSDESNSLLFALKPPQIDIPHLLYSHYVFGSPIRPTTYPVRFPSSSLPVNQQEGLYTRSATTWERQTVTEFISNSLIQGAVHVSRQPTEPQLITVSSIIQKPLSRPADQVTIHSAFLQDEYGSYTQGEVNYDSLSQSEEESESFYYQDEEEYGKLSDFQDDHDELSKVPVGWVTSFTPATFFDLNATPLSESLRVTKDISEPLTLSPNIQPTAASWASTVKGKLPPYSVISGDSVSGGQGSSSLRLSSSVSKESSDGIVVSPSLGLLTGDFQPKPYSNLSVAEQTVLKYPTPGTPLAIHSPTSVYPHFYQQLVSYPPTSHSPVTRYPLVSSSDYPGTSSLPTSSSYHQYLNPQNPETGYSGGYPGIFSSEYVSTPAEVNHGGFSLPGASLGHAGGQHAATSIGIEGPTTYATPGPSSTRGPSIVHPGVATTQPATGVYRCGSVGSARVSNFLNPSYPMPDRGRGTCTFRLLVPDPTVCQVRVDFVESSMVLPVKGRCNGQRLHVSGTIHPMPVNDFCGRNTDQHFYVELVGGRESVDRWVEFSVVTSVSHAVYRYGLWITQVSCTRSDPLLAGSGCLQYFLASSGVIKSYNFEGHQYLNSQDYYICVRTAPGACALSLSAKEGDFGIQKFNSRLVSFDRAGVGARACTRDYLFVPHLANAAVGSGGKASPDGGERLCGGKFSYLHGDALNRQVTGYVTGPLYVLHFKTGEPEVYNSVTHGPGYRLTYHQRFTCDHSVSRGATLRYTQDAKVRMVPTFGLGRSVFHPGKRNFSEHFLNISLLSPDLVAGLPLGIPAGLTPGLERRAPRPLPDSPHHLQVDQYANPLLNFTQSGVTPRTDPTDGIDLLQDETFKNVQVPSLVSKTLQETLPSFGQSLVTSLGNNSALRYNVSDLQEVSYQPGEEHGSKNLSSAGPISKTAEVRKVGETSFGDTFVISLLPEMSSDSQSGVRERTHGRDAEFSVVNNTVATHGNTTVNSLGTKTLRRQNNSTQLGDPTIREEYSIRRRNLSTDSLENGSSQLRNNSKNNSGSASNLSYLNVTRNGKAEPGESGQLGELEDTTIQAEREINKPKPSHPATPSNDLTLNRERSNARFSDSAADIHQIRPTMFAKMPSSDARENSPITVSTSFLSESLEEVAGTANEGSSYLDGDLTSTISPDVSPLPLSFSSLPTLSRSPVFPFSSLSLVSSFPQHAESHLEEGVEEATTALHVTNSKVSGTFISLVSEMPSTTSGDDLRAGSMLVGADADGVTAASDSVSGDHDGRNAGDLGETSEKITDKMRVRRNVLGLAEEREGQAGDLITWYPDTIIHNNNWPTRAPMHILPRIKPPRSDRINEDELVAKIPLAGPPPAAIITSKPYYVLPMWDYDRFYGIKEKLSKNVIEYNSNVEHLPKKTGNPSTTVGFPGRYTKGNPGGYLDGDSNSLVTWYPYQEKMYLDTERENTRLVTWSSVYDK
ncbi:uncharacterized protein [Cherax quadricarinatus]|uniref:uncharacterized protein n=1 Tax=Cherax quadricarinatus TaxID=27406 RepID=UPI00387E2D34